MKLTALEKFFSLFLTRRDMLIRGEGYGSKFC
jgi:hypothetical protein